MAVCAPVLDQSIALRLCRLLEVAIQHMQTLLKRGKWLLLLGQNACNLLSECKFECIAGRTGRKMTAAKCVGKQGKYHLGKAACNISFQGKIWRPARFAGMQTRAQLQAMLVSLEDLALEDPRLPALTLEHLPAGIPEIQSIARCGGWGWSVQCYASQP